MNPVSPTHLHDGGKLVIFGEHQPQYIPLPASVDASGLVMTEWVPSAEELSMLFTGGRIRLWTWKGVVHVCSQCKHADPALLAPVRIEAISPDPLDEYPSEKHA